MTPDQLQRAQELNEKARHLKTRSSAIQQRLRPKGNNATPQQLVNQNKISQKNDENPHTMTFTFDVGTGDRTLALPVPTMLAERFLTELERFYESEALVAEREFERL